MRQRTGWLIGYLVLMLVVSGCNTLADARNARGTGALMIFDASFDTVWVVIPQVVTEVGLTIVRDNKSEGYILAERGFHDFSSGEKVAIFVEKAGSDSRTSVEVVSKRVLTTQLFAPNWITPILEKIQQRLEGP